jgi:hypothetical protein
MLVKVYKDPQLEDEVIATIKIIEVKSEGLPFLLEEAGSSHKDLYYILIHVVGQVVESYCNHLKEGDKRSFKKRKFYNQGITHTTTASYDSELEPENYAINDSFLKVNGKEIF